MGKLSIVLLPALLLTPGAAWPQSAQHSPDQHQQHQPAASEKTDGEGKRMCCCDEAMMRQMMMKMMRSHQPEDSRKSAGTDPDHKH